MTPTGLSVPDSYSTFWDPIPVDAAAAQLPAPHTDADPPDAAYAEFLAATEEDGPVVPPLAVEPSDAG